MSPEQITRAIAYFGARVEEQTLDNILDPECIATEDRPNHKGVDYHVHRKAIGFWLHQRCTLVNGVWRLTPEAEKLVKTIISTGVHIQTVKQWIYKYSGLYIHKSFIFGTRESS